MFAMIIIQKQRIFLIIIAIFISITTCAYTMKKNNIVTTSSLPVSNKVIILDAGHGKPDRSEQVEKMVL